MSLVSIWQVLVHPHSIKTKIIQITDLHLLYRSLLGSLIYFGHDRLRMDQNLPFKYIRGTILHLIYYSKYLWRTGLKFFNVIIGNTALRHTRIGLKQKAIDIGVLDSLRDYSTGDLDSSIECSTGFLESSREYSPGDLDSSREYSYM